MSISSRYRHTLIVRRNTATTGGAAETPGGADTILVADSAPGALVIDVDSDGDMDVGDFLRIGDVGATEIRAIALIGVGGLITLSSPLLLAHDSGDQVREVDDAGTMTLDEYGHPVVAPTTIATVPGLIQPRRIREVALVGQGGVVPGEHTGFMDPLASLTTDCWIEMGGDRYDVMGFKNAGGVDHHYEVTLRRVI